MPDGQMSTMPMRPRCAEAGNPEIPQAPSDATLLINVAKSEALKQGGTATDPLTPPITPEKSSYKHPFNRKGSEDSADTQDLSNILPVENAEGPEATSFSGRELPPDQLPEQPLIYTKAYETQKQLGRGVWSTVYTATEKPAPSSVPPFSELPPSPPSSPPTNAKSTHVSSVLAVKVPSRRDARPILFTEARILTYLHSYRDTCMYVVPFHGFAVPTSAIVMTAVSLTLDAYLKSLKDLPVCTRTMFDPLPGTAAWLSLATQLVDGLDFLHERARVVHGDIKPGNILLQYQTSTMDPILHSQEGNDEDTSNTPPQQSPPPSKEPVFPYKAIYADFSSSYVLPSDTTTDEPPPPAITALTPDYAPPTLLRALYRPTPSNPPIPTKRTDIFSLATTLLVAATGSSPYTGARIEAQKLAFALEGRPLEFARNMGEGLSAARIKKGGLVERCLKGALVVVANGDHDGTSKMEGGKEGKVEKGEGQGLRAWTIEQWKEVVREEEKGSVLI